MREMIQLVDLQNKRMLGMMITSLGEIQFMNKSSLCFCGSGKTNKHCHPNVNERSLVARVLTLYQELDKRNAHARTICKKGCTECCQAVDYDIHLSEMLTIMSYLNIGRDGINRKLFPKLELNWEFTVNGSCLFLNQSEGYCEIYEVRPVICRNYGSVLQDTELACSSLYCADKDALQLIDENDYPKINTQARMLFVLESGKPKPLTIPAILWFKKLIDERYFNDAVAIQMLEDATQRPISKFVKVMQSKATKWWQK